MSERSQHTTVADDFESTQLRLLPGGSSRPDWMLDDRTRTLGRKGIADAREVLRRAKPPEPKQATSFRKAS